MFVCSGLQLFLTDPDLRIRNYEFRIREANLDPDPARTFLRPLKKTGLWIRIHFLRIRIRIQWIRMEANTDPDPDQDPDPIRIQGFNDQKLKKKKQLKKNFFDQKLQFTYP